jgi:hypothetical protein
VNLVIQGSAKQGLTTFTCEPRTPLTLLGRPHDEEHSETRRIFGFCAQGDGEEEIHTSATPLGAGVAAPEPTIDQTAVSGFTVRLPLRVDVTPGLPAPAGNAIVAAPDTASVAVPSRPGQDGGAELQSWPIHLNVNVVNQVVSQGAHSTEIAEVHRALQLLKDQIEKASLPSTERTRALALLQGAQHEVDATTPKKEHIAESLKRIGNILEAAGGAITAGRALSEAIRSVLPWLGEAASRLGLS